MPSGPDPHTYSAFLALFAGYTYVPLQLRAPDTGERLGWVASNGVRVHLAMDFDTAMATVKWSTSQTQPVSLASCLMSEGTFRVLAGSNGVQVDGAFSSGGVLYHLRFLAWSNGILEARAIPVV